MIDRSSSSFISFVGRLPFSIVSAIGIVAVIDTVKSLPNYISYWLEAWRELVRPVWDILFGWFFERFDFECPVLVADYLTMALITTGCLTRTVGFQNDIVKKNRYNYFWVIPVLLIGNFLLSIGWPIVILVAFFEVYKAKSVNEKGNPFFIFIESFGIAGIVLAIGYASFFFFKGSLA